MSSFAKPGYECVHNSNYWLFQDYIGIGQGALVSRLKSLPKSWNIFKHMKQIKPAIFSKKKTLLIKDELVLEHIIANFRTPRGIVFEDYKLIMNLILNRSMLNRLTWQ